MMRIKNSEECGPFFETVMNSIVSTVMVIDKDQKIIFANAAYKKLFHTGQSDWLTNPCEGDEGCIACKLRDSLLPHLVHTVPVQRERMTRKFLIDGQEIIRYFLYSTAYIRLDNQELILVIVDDITETMEALLTLKRIETMDPLTQMYNHKYMYLKLEEEIMRAQRYMNPLSIIMLNIDFFKAINQVYGHQVGDNTLITVSRIIKNSLRDIDVAGHYDGVEFLIILPQTLQEHAFLTAERIRKTIEAHVFEEPELHVTISGSVAEFVNQHKSALHLTDTAENLLFKAKANGRNRIEV